MPPDRVKLQKIAFSQRKSPKKFGRIRKSMYLCTRKTTNDAPVAQLVEHLTLNQGVQGSSPCGCTRNTKKALKKNEVADLKGLLFLAKN